VLLTEPIEYTNVRYNAVMRPGFWYVERCAFMLISSISVCYCYGGLDRFHSINRGMVRNKRNQTLLYASKSSIVMLIEYPAKQNTRAIDCTHCGLPQSIMNYAKLALSEISFGKQLLILPV
jgi:hypothetical protein